MATASARRQAGAPTNHTLLPRLNNFPRREAVKPSKFVRGVRMYLTPTSLNLAEHGLSNSNPLSGSALSKPRPDAHIRQRETS